MKRKLFAAVLASVCLADMSASAQSLKDILNSSLVKDVVSSVTGVNLPTDISGTWDISGTAVKLEGDNIAKNAAATLAATEIEKKLDTCTEKIGLREGTFSYTFNADSTFTTTFRNKSFPGRYSLSPDGRTLHLNYGKTLGLLKMDAVISVNGTQTDIMFKADKLLDFLNKISSASNVASLKTLSALTSQYDGLDLGFAVKKRE